MAIKKICGSGKELYYECFIDFETLMGIEDVTVKISELTTKLLGVDIEFSKLFCSEQSVFSVIIDETLLENLQNFKFRKTNN